MTDTTDVRMMTVADVLPSGQTGFDLTRDHRALVRRSYRLARRKFNVERARRYASLLAADHDRSEYASTRGRVSMPASAVRR